MRLLSANTYKYVAPLLMAVIVAPGASAQDEADSPPPLLKGGIVHQLRSLTEDAKNAFDGARNRSEQTTPSQQRVTRPPRARSQQARNQPRPETAPVALPPQPTGRSTLQRTHTSPWVERQQLAQPAAQAPQRRLPDVIRPEDVVSQKTTAKLSPAAGESLVHVESRIPQAVRDSFRSRTVSQRTETQTKPPTGDTTNAPRQRSTPEIEDDFRPETPRVSRVPLPRQAAAPTEPQESGSYLRQAPDPSALSVQAPQDLPQATPPSSVSVQTSTTAINEQVSLPTLGATLTTSETTQDTIGQGVSLPTRIANVPTLEQQAPASPSLPTLPSTSPPARALTTDFEPSTSPKYPSQSAGPSANTQLPQLPSTSTDSQAASVPSLPATPAPKKPAAAAVSKLPPKSSSPAQTSASESRMTMITPRVQVVLNGPADIPVARPARYEIIVSNQDTINLNGLLLQLDVPAGVTVKPLKSSIGQLDTDVAGDGSTLVSWTFEKLPPGKKAIAPIQLVASSPKNFAVAMEWTLLPVAELARVAVQAPRLELALEGPSEVEYGKANTYRLVIRNPGNATAKDVQLALTAQQYGESSSKIGDIPAGGQESIDVELTFNQKGSINIAAAASSGESLKSNTAIDVVVRRAELVTNVVSPQLVYHGSETPVSVTVTNTGDATAEQIKTTLTLPKGATLQNAPSQVVRVGSEARWTISKLSPGESQQLPLGISFGNAGENLVELACQTGSLTSRATSMTVVEAVADLILLVNDPPAPAPIGSEVTYTLKLTNRGSKAAKDVTVVTQFSDGIEPSRGAGRQYKIVPGQLFFDPISSIAAGETVELKVFAKAQSSGMHRFRAEVKTAEEAMRLVQEEATKYMDTVRRVASPIPTGVIR